MDTTTGNQSTEEVLEEKFEEMLEPLTERLELIQLKLEKQEIQAGTATKEEKPWWSTLIQVLGLPALIVYILLQVTQTSQVIQDTDKSAAETSKIRAEELKARAELELLLDDLAQKRAEGIEAYQEQIEEVLPQLDATIERLNTINQQRQQAFFEGIFPKFVILWAVFIGVSLLFDIITQIWGTLIGSATVALYSATRKAGEQRERLRNVITYATMILTPLPSILRWAITISLFVALVIPLFNETAQYLGSDVRFRDVAESSRHLNIGKAINELREILF